ncbi:MAG: citrate/2-methylcitrate synthase [Acidimicrobiales bacterium]
MSADASPSPPPIRRPPTGGDDGPTRRGLTTPEAAARLGIKRETLYAYVSRGVVARTIGPDGRTSLFDPAEIERLRQGRRRDDDGVVSAFIATALTRVDDEGLWIRGRDLIRAVGEGVGFIDIVDELWAGDDDESWPPLHVDGDRLAPEMAAAVAALTTQGSLLDALRLIVAHRSAADPLRHDLSPRSVRAAGRRLIIDLALGLPPRDDHRSDDHRSGDGHRDDRTLAHGLWRRLTATAPRPDRVRALDAALALLIDHWLAASTFAARIAASVRADPYSVVAAGLGVLGGPLHGAASAGVQELLAAAEELGDAPRAVGETRRRLGAYPGFGHSVYTVQDPRYGALMALIVSAWGDDRRLVDVYRVRDVIGERTDAIPNVDLAIGALIHLADMPPDAGEVMFAVSRTAGWLAHAMEEYEERPLRFRPRARYAGPSPTRG